MAQTDSGLLDRVMSRRALLQAGMVAGGSLALAACGKGGGTSTSSSTSGAFAVPTSKPDRLVVRTWGPPWSTAIQDTAVKAFTAKTGIPISFDQTDFGPTQTKIQQALAAGQRPPVDVNHTVGFFAERARVQNLVLPLDTEHIVTNFADLLPIGKPATGGSEYVNLYSYTFPVIYAKDRIQPPADMSWGDLLRPEYKATFVAASTFEVLLFPFAKMLGLDVAADDLTPVFDELAKLRPNIVGVGQDTEFVDFMKSGQANWGAFIVGNAFALRDAGVNVDWVVPKEGSSLSVDSMYVPKGLPDDVSYWAQEFVNTVLDPENLTKFAAIMGVVPTNSKSKPAASMAGDPAFPFTQEEIDKYAIPFSLPLAAEHQDEWQARYTTAIQGS